MDRARHTAFTLIELLVVLTLFSVIAGLTVVNLDGFSAEAKLRSAVLQHASVIQLARVHAQASGQPRLVEYSNSGMVLRKPARSGGQWGWDEGMVFELPAGVALPSLLTPASDQPVTREMLLPPNGRTPQHGVVFTLDDVSMAALFSTLDEPKWKLLDRKMKVEHWDDLLNMLEGKP